MTDYPKPALTADVVAFAIDPAGRLRALFIRRGKEPFAGRFAFPGGFVEQGEDAATGAARELEEETGLTGVTLEQVGAFTAPGRDPRGWVVSVAFVTAMTWNEAQLAKGGDDAAEAKWLEIVRRDDGKADARDGDDIAELAFDHDEVLAWALARFEQRVAFWTLHRMLAAPFSIDQARGAFEAVLGERLDPMRFVATLEARSAIVKVDGGYAPQWPLPERWG